MFHGFDLPALRSLVSRVVPFESSPSGPLQVLAVALAAAPPVFWLSPFRLFSGLPYRLVVKFLVGLYSLF
jgi:hypothetical protein